MDIPCRLIYGQITQIQDLQIVDTCDHYPKEAKKKKGKSQKYQIIKQALIQVACMVTVNEACSHHRTVKLLNSRLEVLWIRRDDSR